MNKKEPEKELYDIFTYYKKLATKYERVVNITHDGIFIAIDKLSRIDDLITYYKIKDKERSANTFKSLNFNCTEFPNECKNCSC